MGCSGTKEKLEDKIMLIKLARMEIQMEKEKELKKLSEMEGKPVKRVLVPDYIDPVFAKENNLYEDEILFDTKSKKGKKNIKKGISETKSKSEISKKKVKRNKNQDKISDINITRKKKKVK